MAVLKPGRASFARHYREAVIERCRITNGQKHNKGRPLGMFSCRCGFRYLRVGPDKDDNDRYGFTRVDSYGAFGSRTLGNSGTTIQ